MPPPLLLLLLLLLPPPPLRGAPRRRQQKPVMVVTVQEGLCTLVPCTFLPGSLYMGKRYRFWFQKGADINRDPPVATDKPQLRVQERTRGRFFLIGDPEDGNCSLSIRDVNVGDSGAYVFVTEATLRVKQIYSGKEFSLEVTALTHKPKIRIPGSLESGRPANLSCSTPWACEQSTPPIFSWTSAALTSLGPRTPLSSALSLTPRPQDHGTRLACQVHLPGVGVTAETTVQLSVAYAPQNTAISVFQGNSTALKVLRNASSLTVLEGQALRLLCEAPSNPPASLSWFRGSPALNATPISNSSTLELLSAGPPEEGALTCLAQHPLGSQRVSLHLLVQSSLQLLGPSCSPEDEDTDRGLLCSCSARARPAPALRWRLGEQLLEGSSSNGSVEVTLGPWGLWANSSLRLGGGALGTLSCEARNAREARSAALLLLPRRAGRAEPGRHRVRDALGGAGAVALLALCLYLLFRLKAGTCGDKAAQLMGRSAAANPAREAGARAQQHGVWTDAPSEPSASPGAGAACSGEQELQYAFLSFHKAKPRQLESSDTLYSEIKTHQ